MRHAHNVAEGMPSGEMQMSPRQIGVRDAETVARHTALHSARRNKGGAIGSWLAYEPGMRSWT
jgi:hypothetical protein